jgi:DNA repair protein RecN (Recombination protein N)
MLKQLDIRNFTLIDELTVDFRSGFSVITGETGAGKSIIVGAIGLLLGGRADCKYVKNGQNRCVIEAHFDISNYGMQDFFVAHDVDYDSKDCIMRREINSNGKSRAFINDIPVPLSTMRELGESLVDVHSQHQNLLLNKEDFQLSVVDIIAHSDKQIAAYKHSFQEYSDALATLEELKSDIEKNRENEDFLRFEYNELSELNLKENEQASLEHDVETGKHAEEIKSAIFSAGSLLDNDSGGVIAQIRQAEDGLKNIAEFYPEIKDIVNRLEDSYIELKDIASDLNGKTEDIDFNPKQLNELTERLDLIYSMENKYHVRNDTDLISFFHSVNKQLQEIDCGDDNLKELSDKVDALKADCVIKAKKLHELRLKASAVIEKEMQGKLSPLGIPNVNFKVNLTEKSLSDNGSDKVSFLFSANKSMPLQPVSQVASGGEISRVMLSIKAMISGAVKLPTIIFDEIDTGVSGRVAEKMARIMSEMGQNNRQVIAITHLPQIAAFGKTHYKVTKSETENGTTSNMRMLNHDERVGEIASMLSGSNVTQAARDNAEELLANV